MQSRLWMVVSEAISLNYKEEIPSVCSNLAELPGAVDAKTLDRLRYRLFWQAKYALSSAMFIEAEEFRFDLGNALVSIRLQGSGWVICVMPKSPVLPENIHQEEARLLDILRRLLRGIPVRATARILPSDLTTRQLRLFRSEIQKRKHSKCVCRSGVLTCVLPGSDAPVMVSKQQDMHSRGLAADAGDAMLSVCESGCNAMLGNRTGLPAANWMIPERRTVTLLLTEQSSLSDLAGVPHPSFSESGLFMSQVECTGKTGTPVCVKLAMAEPNMLNGRAHLRLCEVKDVIRCASDILSDFEWHLLYLCHRDSMLTYLHFTMEDIYAAKADRQAYREPLVDNGRRSSCSVPSNQFLLMVRSTIEQLDLISSVDAGKFSSFAPRYQDYKEAPLGSDAQDECDLVPGMEFLLGVTHRPSAVATRMLPVAYLHDSPIPLSLSRRELRYTSSLQVNLEVARELIDDMNAQYQEQLAEDSERQNESVQRSNLVIQLLVAVLVIVQVSKAAFPNISIAVALAGASLLGLAVIMLLNRILASRSIARFLLGRR